MFGVCVKFPGKKHYVTLEWPLMDTVEVAQISKTDPHVFWLTGDWLHPHADSRRCPIIAATGRTIGAAVSQVGRTVMSATLRGISH